ncbi:MAG: PorT family protein [Flavobacterium sp.]|uniref:outer membrane beta-barrel protein n=1 Tax=Flavobacterium sp. TaxID=239 RepID=UPI0011F427AE|nr:outer membrane beta-barrel protein [Flavobacterium sp.]RZJ67942.1 MAG: PorT family protein [Flavobacterium sp.]
MKKALLAAVLFTSAASFAQYNYRDSNRIGIIGGLNQTDLKTSNFDTKAEMGWNVGLSVRGNFYNDFDMVYAIEFFEGKFSVPTTNALTPAIEDVDLKIQGVKISLMPSYKIVENHLSIEAGPVLQVNGKLKYKSDYEDNFVDDLPITIKDIEDVSTFNILGAVGITAGVRHVRLNAQYQYGFNNFLNKVENNTTGSSFKGNLHVFTGTLILYL